MIKISSFAKAKSNSNGNNNASSGGVIVPTVIMKKTPNVRIWGQWHDHTGDVNGDMTVEGKIDVTGDITTQSSVIGKKGDFEDIVSKTLKATDIQSTNIVSDNGFINNISSSSINTDSIDANYGRYDELVVENLVGENGTFHNLTVTGKAHFFELVIDKITASGGAVIFSPADGFEVEKVIWMVNSSTDYLNIPSDFILPTNYHLIDYNNLNYTRAVIDVGGNKSNAFVVRPYNTTLDMDWYYFWETGELIRRDKIVELKYPDLYGQYSVIETTTPKDSSGVYNYKYEIVEEDTHEYLYNMSYPDGYTLIDYKKLKYSVYGHDIDGNRVEVPETIKYATKVWVGNVEELWFYEEDILETDVKNLYPKYKNLWQSYTRTYTPNITTGGISKSYFTLNPYLLFLAENEQGRAIRNEWQVNDQAICRNFNEAKVGSSQNVKNKYYWGLVVKTDYIDTNIGMQFDQIYIDKDGNLTGDYLAEEQFHVYHAIALDASDYDGELDCEPGDAIAMLGNRKDKDRQKAIYISSYTSLDPSLEAPLFAQYEGINTYSLDGKKTTWFAANGNKIQGKLVVENGKTVEDLISDSEDRTDDELQKLIEKYNNWLNNVEDDLTESYLKALPTTKKVAKTYNGWKQAIGTTVTFETITFFNQSTQKYEVFGQTNQFFPSLSKDDRVAVEVTINQSYQDSTMPNKGTVLGTVLQTPMGMMQHGTNKVTFRTTVRIEYIIDADLSQVWLGMSQLKVEQDNIKMTVTNLGNDLTDKINQGIASLEIRAGQIESKVDNLQGDVSSITQQADNIQLQVNELAIKIDGQKGKIILNGDTEVNGTVQVNKNGVGFSLMGSNGERFDILSKSIGTFESFSSKTEDFYIGTNGRGSASVTASGGYDIIGGNTTGPCQKQSTVTIQNIIELGYISEGKMIKIDTLSINKNGLTTTVSPNNRLCSGWSVFNSMNIDLLDGNNGQVAQSTTLTDSNSGILLTFNVKSSSNYKLRVNTKITVTARLEKDNTPPSYDKPIGMQPGSCTATVSYNSFIVFKYYISCDAYGQIAYDGIGMNFGGGNVCYMADDNTVIKYGEDFGLKINTNGIYRLIPKFSKGMFYGDGRKVPINYVGYNKWVKWNSLNVRHVKKGSEGVVTINNRNKVFVFDNDDVIVFDSSNFNNKNCYLVMPNPATTDAGRIIYFKTLQQIDCRVVAHNYNDTTNKGSSNTILYCYNDYSELCSHCDLMSKKDKATTIILINLGSYWAIWNGGAIWNDDKHQVGSNNIKA